MGKRGWWREGLLQLGLVVVYGLFHLAIHPLSTAHWPIHEGIRLACLLLMPYRYWPALYIGEALPNAYEVLPCTNLGTTWIAIRCIPPCTVVMPIVWWCRRRLPPLPSPSARVLDIRALLVCVVLASLGRMAYSWTNACFLSTVTSPLDILSWLVDFFLGPYLSIVSVVPWVLIAWLDYRPGHWREQIRAILTSRLTLDTAALLIPAISILAWISRTSSEQTQLMATTAMALPLVWLTLKHGWRAVAVSAPLVIACISIPIPPEEAPDEKLDAIMAFLTMIVTSLFVFGAFISVQLAKEEQQRLTAPQLKRSARHSFQLSEHRMRSTSQAMEYLAATMHSTNGRVLEQLRRMTPAVENHTFYKEVLNAQSQLHRLAESMHPVAWRERGLPAALHDTVARALDEAGIDYCCQVKGRGFSRLAYSVLTAAYRTVCEAVVYVAARLACNRVNLVLRSGETHGRRWLVLRVEGVLEDHGVARAVYHAQERKRLAVKLGASMLDMAEMGIYAQIFDGMLHARSFAHRLRLTALLYDIPREEQSERARPAPSMRLWVR